MLTVHPTHRTSSQVLSQAIVIVYGIFGVVNLAIIITSVWIRPRVIMVQCFGFREVVCKRRDQCQAAARMELSRHCHHVRISSLSDPKPKIANSQSCQPPPTPGYPRLATVGAVATAAAPAARR